MTRTTPWLKWVVVLAVLMAMAWGVARLVAKRQAAEQALAQAQIAREDTPVELAASDVVTARVVTLVQGLPVSGALKAVNSAIVKARVAGELQGLTLREGDFVKAGQVIARIDATEYTARARQSQQQAASAKAQVEVTQRQYDNNKALVDQGFISKTALDTSLANLDAARATYQAALAGVDVANKSVQDTVLKAPIDGQVSQRLAQPGERVGIDARVIEIVDLSRLELEASLSASDGAQVQVGQTAKLRIEGNSQPIMARVARINPSAQAGSRSVLAYLSIVPPEGSTLFPLRQGLYAQGALDTQRVDMLAVPVNSVRTDRPAAYVTTVETVTTKTGPALALVNRPVELGLRGNAGINGEAMVAIKGLNDGAQVLRSAAGSLREGTRVRLTAVAAPNGNASSAPQASP
ncbi:MAG: efflux RND transporter periplasmic adaptor subunit [Polaromonas sp.]|nr:efflux RND transporter periplasmic adaptor subunit [Polaromonas sp.]